MENVEASWRLWRCGELAFLSIYASVFYGVLAWHSLRLSSGKEVGKLWGLRRGWISDRFSDLSDAQWRNFRGNLPILLLVMSVFAFLGLALRRGFKLRSTGMSYYWLIASLVYLAYMHGFCVLFMAAIAMGNYLVTKMAGGTSVFPIIIWSYNLAFLVLNRVYEGYSFASFGEYWSFLDNHRGTLRWHISFNLVMLRMVSFGLDYHWACLSRPSTINWEKHNASCNVCHARGACYTSHQDKHLDRKSYNFVAYLSYLFYAPLYIAGPIVSFNAFSSQLENPQTTYEKLQVAVYGLRWLACMLLMELITHFFYYNAFAVNGLWPRLSPVQIFIVGYGVLNFMWLKFLLIWRFFRFWALVSGIETPENMLRCVNNCYDLEGFWKSWHASYNRWLVRYLYVPLGGTRWRLLNVWVIFTFVAVWHDLEWKLLSWAWVTCILWVPELLVKLSLRNTRLQRLQRSAVLFRECCAVASALNITGLMMANLIGFVVGPSGFKELVSRLFVKQNAGLLFGIFFSFYVGAKIMFRVREAEPRKDKKR